MYLLAQVFESPLVLGIGSEIPDFVRISGHIVKFFAGVFVIAVHNGSRGRIFLRFAHPRIEVVATVSRPSLVHMRRVFELGMKIQNVLVVGRANTAYREYIEVAIAGMGRIDLRAMAILASENLSEGTASMPSGTGAPATSRNVGSMSQKLRRALARLPGWITSGHVAINGMWMPAS